MLSSRISPLALRVAIGSSEVALLLLLFMVGKGHAYTPQRDSAAINAMQYAVATFGGSSAVASIQDCVVTGSTANGNGSSASFTWTTSGSEFRFDTTLPDGRTNTFLSGHGSPAWVLNGSTKSLNSFMARASQPFYLPGFVLYQKLQNSILTLTYVGYAQLNGNQVIQVHVSDDSDAVGTVVTSHEWYFDPTTFLPVRVQFREPANENASNFSTATYDLSQYAAVSGVLVPYSVSYSGDTTATMTVHTVTFNSGVAQGIFDPPQGGQ